MRQPPAFGAGDAGEGADLVDQHRFEFGGRKLHCPPAETLQVGKRRMCAEADAGSQCLLDRAAHHQRIAGMETTGDVGRADDVQQFVIAAHFPGPEAFTQIGVEIDLPVILPPTVK
jgi:hypothetical protein